MKCLAVVIPIDLRYLTCHDRRKDLSSVGSVVLARAAASAPQLHAIPNLGKKNSVCSLLPENIDPEQEHPVL